MFIKREDPIEQKLENEIINLLELMNGEIGYTEDYQSMSNQVTELMKLRQGSKVSKDTWVTVGTHIVGVLLILNHERANVIASKAFSLVKKIV